MAEQLRLAASYVSARMGRNSSPGEGAEDEAPFLRRDFHRSQLGGARESERRHWLRELGLRAAGGAARPRAEWDGGIKRA